MFSYSDVKRVKTITDPNEVNTMLEDGWVLLNTYTYISGDSVNDLTLVYVLGLV